MASRANERLRAWREVAYWYTAIRYKFGSGYVPMDISDLPRIIRTQAADLPAYPEADLRERIAKQGEFNIKFTGKRYSMTDRRPPTGAPRQNRRPPTAAHS